MAPTIQIRSLAACGPLRACRPETLFEKEFARKQMDCYTEDKKKQLDGKRVQLLEEMYIPTEALMGVSI